MGKDKQKKAERVEGAKDAKIAKLEADLVAAQAMHIDRARAWEEKTSDLVTEIAKLELELKEARDLVQRMLEQAPKPSSPPDPVSSPEVV